MKEVKLKHFAGPFKEIPYKHDFIQSPIGLVPKDNDRDTHLIFHLSYSRTGPGSPSVNANTPKELCSIKYPDFSYAIRRCIEEGISCAIGKSDVSTAFRNLGLSAKFWRYLIMKAWSPKDGLWYYFVDKCLPFGAAISCALFQAVSDAIAHTVQSRTKKKPINYLDDYLFAAALQAWCDLLIQVFIDVCGEVGLPVALTKTSWSDTLMVFLGFLIDTFNQVISVPTEKVAKGLNMINHILAKREKIASKRKMTILQLQKLCGFLNFLGTAIVPGRAFTSHLYSHLAGSTHLKLHHHIRISNEIFEDLTTWKQFLQHQTVYCRPFLDFTCTLTADQIQFYTDASKISP